MTEFNVNKTIGFAIIHTSRLLNNRMNEQLCSLGDSVTREQGAVLLLIAQGKNQDMIQNDIAEMMDKSKSAILRTIDILEKKGYVTRVGCPEDRRKNILQITESGEKVAEQVIEMIKWKNKELLEEVTPEELETFFKVLEALQKKLEAEENHV